MNKKITIFIYAFLIALIGSLLLIKKPWAVQKNQIQTTFLTQSDSQGSVTVEVTPVTVSKDSKTWQFEVALNTHSVELNQDLTQVTVLKDSKGQEYKPLDWSGTAAGGHHRQGVLTFQAISPRPSSIEIVVKNIDGVPERKFNWNL